MSRAAATHGERHVLWAAALRAAVGVRAALEGIHTSDDVKRVEVVGRSGALGWSWASALDGAPTRFLNLFTRAAMSRASGWVRQFTAVQGGEAEGGEGA